ncbi:MAG: hypothetical protein EXR21_07230 [Flavobacteriaceae bacterium]|nr:hypothetical protein [Flavobacteriaceae bacterium]
MKRIALLSITTLLGSILLFTACNKTAKSKWTNVFRLPIGGSGSGHEILRLQCKSASIGYAVTPVGFIHTSQGGRLWSDGGVLPSSTGYDITDFDFTSEKGGLCIAHNGTATRVFSTIDGGKEWSQKSSTSATILIGKLGKKLFMKDAMNGIIVTANIEFLSTTDGGITWKNEGKLGTSQNYMPEIALFGNTITALERSGKVSQSVDNGKTWLTKGTIPNGSTFSRTPFSIETLDGKTMYATLLYGTYKSTNAGANWVKVTTESATLGYLVRMYDFNKVSVIGVDGNTDLTVWTSIDDAASWSKHVLGTEPDEDTFFDMIGNGGLAISGNDVYAYAE